MINEHRRQVGVSDPRDNAPGLGEPWSVGRPADPVPLGVGGRDGTRMHRRLPAKTRHATGIGTQRALGRALGRRVAFELSLRGVDPSDPTYDSHALQVRDRLPLMYDFVVVPSGSQAALLHDAWDAAFWRALHANRDRWGWLRAQVEA